MKRTGRAWYAREKERDKREKGMKETKEERNERNERRKDERKKVCGARRTKGLSLSLSLSLSFLRAFASPSPSLFLSFIAPLLLRSALLSFCSSPRLFSHLAAASSPTELFATPLTLDGGGSSGNCVSIFSPPAFRLTFFPFVRLSCPEGNRFPETSARKLHTEDVRPFTNDDPPPIDFHLSVQRISSLIFAQFLQLESRERWGN